MVKINTTMKVFRLFSGWLLLTFVFTACKGKTESVAFQDSTQTKLSTTSNSSFIGDFVSESYFKRNEGNDWVAFTVRSLNDSTLHISVRSRADKKKPTCRFDADIIKVGNATWTSNIEGKKIRFSFSDASLTVEAEDTKDKSILSYYCSGGGSLAGTYRKINEPLDRSMIDSLVFHQILILQNISFDISTTGEGSVQQLRVQPIGLLIDNRVETMPVEGSVTGAEIGDLNADGSPEVLIYTVSAGSGSYGDVIGFSVNNKKSMSRIYFPNIHEDPKANKGFMGHDSFAIVENTLVQRFRIYNEGDTNSKPTGGYRQIQYKLKNGEASRKFVVDKIVDFPAQ
jgi:hypothetical protein